MTLYTLSKNIANSIEIWSSTPTIKYWSRSLWFRYLNWEDISKIDSRNFALITNNLPFVHNIRVWNSVPNSCEVHSLQNLQFILTLYLGLELSIFSNVPSGHDAKNVYVPWWHFMCQLIYENTTKKKPIFIKKI